METKVSFLSKEKQDAFDDFYKGIDKRAIKLKQKGWPCENCGHEIPDSKCLNCDNEQERPDYAALEKAVKILERNLEDFTIDYAVPHELIKHATFSAIYFVESWLVLFRIEGSNGEFVNSLHQTMLSAAVILADADNRESNLIKKYFLFLSPTRIKEHTGLFPKYVDISAIEDTTSSFQLVKEPTTARPEYTRKLKDIESFIRYLKYTMAEDVFGFIDNTLSKLLPEVEPVSHAVSEQFNFWIDSVLESAKEKHTKIDLFSQEVTTPISETWIKIVSWNQNDVFDFIDRAAFKTDEIESFRAALNRSSFGPSYQRIKDQETEDTFIWDIEVTVDKTEVNAAQIGFLIWSLAKSLESIDGVEVDLVEWSEGSKKFNLITTIKGIAAREDVKYVFAKGREAAEAVYVDKPVEDVKKTKAEREKTEKKTDALPSKQESKDIRELEIEKKKLDIEEQRVDILAKKLDSIKSLAALMKEGVIQNETDLHILINDLLFVSKKEGRIQIGENMDLYEERESKESDDTEEGAHELLEPDPPLE